MLEIDGIPVERFKAANPDILEEIQEIGEDKSLTRPAARRTPLLCVLASAVRRVGLLPLRSD